MGAAAAFVLLGHSKWNGLVVLFPTETVLSSVQALVIDMGWEQRQIPVILKYQFDEQEVWGDNCRSPFCAYRDPRDDAFGCNRKFCLINTTLTDSVEILGASKVGGKKEVIYQVMNCKEYFSGVGFPLDPMPDFP